MVPKTTHEKRTRAMETGGFLFDEGLTRAALELAAGGVRDNVLTPMPTTEEQAAELFRTLTKGREPWKEGRHLEDETATFSTDDWHQAQQWLQKFLPRIAGAHKLAESSAAALARDLSEAIVGVGIGEPRVSRRLGRYELTMYSRHDSIWSACIRAILPFLPEYGWARRLGQCELSECGRWFLRENKSGPLKQYCCDEHASLVRIRRYRGIRA